MSKERGLASKRGAELAKLISIYKLPKRVLSHEEKIQAAIDQMAAKEARKERQAIAIRRQEEMEKAWGAFIRTDDFSFVDEVRKRQGDEKKNPWDGINLD